VRDCGGHQLSNGRHPQFLRRERNSGRLRRFGHRTANQTKEETQMARKSISRRLRRPSAALVLSAIAVFMSLGGVSYGLAAASIDSRAIKNNEVRSIDIRNGQVKGKDVKNGSVRGPDVLESSLGLVPSAQSAQTAQSAQSAESAQSAQSAGSVDGLNLAKIDYAAPVGTAQSDVVSIGGVTIQASCSAGGDIAVQARSEVEDSMIHVTTVDPTTSADSGGDTPGDVDSRYGEDDSFDLGQAELLSLPANGDSTHGSFSFAAPNGSVVTASYLIEEDTDALGSANDCFVKGTAVQG
jgi:hypothetical protein